MKRGLSSMGALVDQDTLGLIPFFLVFLAPSGAFALAAGYAPSLIPFLLALYWGLLPPLLYGAGAVLDGRLPFLRLPRFRGEIYALALPYLLYWPTARRIGLPFLGAFLAFMRGPGVGVPLATLLSPLLGRHLPPLLVTLAVLVLAFFLERAAKRFFLRKPPPLPTEEDA
jgi:hypothetical protein